MVMLMMRIIVKCVAPNTLLIHLPWQEAEKWPQGAAATFPACVDVWQTSPWLQTIMLTSSRRLLPGRTSTTADPRLAQTGGVVVVVAATAVMVVVVAATSRARDGGCCGEEGVWRRACGCRKAINGKGMKDLRSEGKEM